MNKDKIKIIKFILPASIILIIAFFLNSKPYTLYLAAALVITSVILPSVVLKMIQYIEFASPFLSKLIYIPLLTLSFVFLIWPIGLIRKILGKDKIVNKNYYRNEVSNFEQIEKEYTADDLIHPF